MQRRSWLKLGLGATVAAALAVLGQRFWPRAKPTRPMTPWQREVRTELERALVGYDLDPDTLWQFLEDAARYRSFLRDGSSRRIDLASRFLLSTDFFERGADPARPARYVRLFHPWITPCAAPPG